MTEENAEKALHWLIHIFEQYTIRYQITGGLAARAYGSERPLHDMDFDVEAGAFDKIMPAVEKYVVFGPGPHEDAEWSTFLLTLEYASVRINLAETATRIFDREKSVWTDWPVDFESSSTLEVLGEKVPVISRERLLAYKKVLGRPQDYLDQEALESK